MTSKRTVRLALAVPISAVLLGSAGCAQEGVGEDEFGEVEGRVGDLEAEIAGIDERLGVLEEEVGVEDVDE